MARMLAQLLLPILMVAVSCGRADSDASGGRTDTAQPAAAPLAAQDTAQARQAVLRLEEELFQSYMRGDTAPAARILAENYIGFTGDGMRETKTQALANLRGGDSTKATTSAVDSIHVDSTIVRVYGDAVVAQASGTFQVRGRPQSATVGFRNTDVFVWRDGRWQVLASHVSKVAEPQGRSRTQ